MVFGKRFLITKSHKSNSSGDGTRFNKFISYIKKINFAHKTLTHKKQTTKRCQSNKPNTRGAKESVIGELVEKSTKKDKSCLF